MALWVTVLAVFLVAAAVKGGGEPPLVAPLLDGLIVRGGEEIAVQEGTWTVLVVLEGRGTEYLTHLHDKFRVATGSMLRRLRDARGSF